ncbi:beta-ketoacyl-ACP synthase [Larsenimonas rhizosphaerae]|uniref:Beta-ketoacyl-ACP synthase n=1 Tax=Larsenimonas rhizosphaerae TaxID=2944682 RepID=A0AA42CV08_9GAMM|nr:beta-ketoacyl-ACP synthase [Larsenimonas rhizosphaerae]MCX2524944.1 beta-ketoacyl-ACP synthase [Larsenimonas rhizosphaerae]
MSQQIPCRLSAPGIASCLGSDLSVITKALETGTRGLTMCSKYTPGHPLALGAVTMPLPDMSHWPARHQSRNNQLSLAALEALGEALPALLASVAPERIGVVMGSSTSGVSETEAAIDRTGPGNDFDDQYCYFRQELGATSAFIAHHLGIRGPQWTISTACTSGARALSAARRLLASGQCDAVIAGGADTLCNLTVHGFASLDAVSATPCLPFSRHRDGINIGEAAVVFIVTRDTDGIQLTGYGETSDAHHISAPHPEGDGAARAMAQALTMAGTLPQHIGYLNAHGTATPHNDAMEARAIDRVFGHCGVPVSATKALTGHTLGAAGALEAAFAWLSLTHQFLPVHVHDGHYDDRLPPLDLVSSSIPGAPLTHAMSNVFAFGGNNATLLLERTS